MEKPLFEYKNYLRNILIATIWTLLFFVTIEVIGFTSLLLETYPNWNPELNWIVLLITSMLAFAIGWNIRFLRLNIYVDVIDFKEHGPHPNLGNHFGIAFENIYDYKITRLTFTFKWLVIRRKNGKTIRRLLSLSQSEYIGFSEILNEKIKKNIMRLKK